LGGNLKRHLKKKKHQENGMVVHEYTLTHFEISD
jgi:hypothetical protein